MPATEHPTLHLTARAGEPVTIELAAAAGGYEWHAPSPPPHCHLAEADGATTGPGVGGPVQQRFVLTCDAPGARTLRFVLRRAWEADAREVQRVDIEVG